MYDPDRDFVPLFDFSAPLTGFGDDFEDENGEKHICISANFGATFKQLVDPIIGL